MKVNVLVGGGYAWLATVAGPAFGLSSDWLVRGCALSALATLLFGVLLSSSRPRPGRLLTLFGFLGFSVLTWFLLGEDLTIASLDALRAAVGGLGWMLFAFGWGSVRSPRAVPEEDPRVIHGAPLKSQRSPSWQPTAVLALAVAGGIVCWGLSWRVQRSNHAVLAQALALAVTVALVAAGARVGLGLGQRRRWFAARRRLSRAATSCGTLVLLAVVGVAWSMFRGQQ